MTIQELLISESLRSRISNEYDKVGIDPTLLDSTTVVSLINHSQTAEQWVKKNGENHIHIVLKYKKELQQRQNEVSMFNDAETIPKQSGQRMC